MGFATEPLPANGISRASRIGARVHHAAALV
ncbi:MAG: hypothetical protein ACI8W7_002192, partial [Gammaproteobacteria bacterium]